MNDYYEVIYNNKFGGYRFTQDFVEKVFEKYPPHTEIGAKLFERCDGYFINEGETPDLSMKIYFVITDKTEFLHGYSFLTGYHSYNKNYARKTHYLTRDDKNYYFLTPFDDGWRDSQEVISMGKELGIFNDKDKKSSLCLVKIPAGYGYDIHDYDGMESITIFFPWKKVITEMLDYIDGKDKSELSEMTRMILNKERKMEDEDKLMLKLNPYEPDEDE